MNVKVVVSWEFYWGGRFRCQIWPYAGYIDRRPEKLLVGAIIKYTFSDAVDNR